MSRVACLFSLEFYDTVEHPLPGWDKIPFGLSIIAACLEQAQHEVRCWVVCPATDLAQSAREIVEAFGCEMALASSVATQFPLIAQLCEHIKRLKPSVPILLGGVHATLCPEECIAHPAIDAVCTGEGEEVAVAWVNALAAGLQPSGIPGTWNKIPGQAEIDRTPPALFRTHLDDLPMVNYAHWERWVDPADRRVHVLLGRGCPYSCTYCSNHALRRTQAGRYVRFRSPENILAEIHMLVERFPDLQSIYLEVETIGASIPWAMAMSECLTAFNAGRAHPLLFRANLAVTTHLVRHRDQLHSLLESFRRANLRTLHVGLESGSERIRREILNRPPYTNADLIDFCHCAHQVGIEIVLYTMIGLPTETAADAVETSRIARACEPLDIDLSVYYPYPGTKLRELSARMNLIDPRNLGVSAERSRVYLKLEAFPRWRVLMESIVFHWRVFHGRRPSMRLLRQMLWRLLRTTPALLMASVRFRNLLPSHRRRVPHVSCG